MEVLDRVGGDLPSLKRELEALPTGHIPTDELFDLVTHHFPFDFTRAELEIEEAFAVFEDPRMANVWLRGLFLQYGYDHYQDPAACMAFHDRYPQVDARERAFGLANGMAWGLVSQVHSSDKIDHDLVGHQLEALQNLPRSIFLEELGWQIVSNSDARVLEPPRWLASTLDEGELCPLWHGMVRARTGGKGSLEATEGLAAEAPRDCRMHVFHGAQHQRCPTPIHFDRGAAIMEPCGIAPGEIPAWADLDVLP